MLKQRVEGSNRKKILFFIGNLGSGGKERRLLVLLKELSKKDLYDLHIVLIRDLVHYSEFHALSIEYSYLVKAHESKFPPRLYLNLWKIMKTSRPSLVHVWGAEEAAYMGVIAKIMGIPMINNQITSSTPVTGLLSKTINKINFKFSDFILSNSEAGLRVYNPPHMKSGVIHNGMNLERFMVQACAIKEEMGIPEDSLIVVMVARFCPGKDYDTLLEVARKVCEVLANLYFLLVGDGPERPRIQSKAEAMRITERVKLLGKRKDVEAILLSSDIGVLLSNVSIVTEGLSNSVMEYMTAGLPVIATNAGGNPEIVDHGVTGYLVNDKDANQISEFALKLATNLVLRKEMGDRGKARIINEFSIDKFVDSHIDVIDCVINGSK